MQTDNYVKQCNEYSERQGCFSPKFPTLFREVRLRWRGYSEEIASTESCLFSEYLSYQASCFACGSPFALQQVDFKHLHKLPVQSHTSLGDTSNSYARLGVDTPRVTESATMTLGGTCGLCSKLDSLELTLWKFGFCSGGGRFATV